MRLMILILATTLGCTMPTANEELRNRDWSLVWIEGFATLPAGVQTPTIRFGTDGRLTGNTACNQAGAGYTVDGNNLTIDALISTKRACIDAQGNALERAYLQAVDGTEAYRITNGELELLDSNGTVTARFTASP